MIFEQLSQLPPDPILGTGQAYAADKNPKKVNLSVGVYQTKEGKTPVMQAVKKAEQQMLEQQESKAYIVQEGDQSFLEGMRTLLFGEQGKSLDRLGLVSVPGGCGGLRIASELFRQTNPQASIWISDPSWPNHYPLITSAGMNTEVYPYFDSSNSSVDFSAMMNRLDSLAEGDIVLLHGCCHNPTGADLSLPQWRELISLCQRRRLIPFIDIAYHGLGDGLEEDRLPIQLISEQIEEAVIVASCSKNFGLYRERTGALIILAANAKEMTAAKSHAISIARCAYTIAPYHGSGIVGFILRDDTLREMWQSELQEMRETLINNRQLLTSKLNQLQNKKDFSFIVNNMGMFSYLGISREQVLRLRQQYAIYLLESSRINVVGVNPGNIDYTINAIVEVLDSSP